MKWWYYFLFACTFYYIAFSGLANSIKSSVSLQLSKRQSIPNIDDNVSEPSSYLNEVVIDEWKEKISVFILSQEGFKNPTLTLMDVASHLSTITKHISTVINQGYKSNFNDFVNSFRVGAVKDGLSQGKHTKFTLLSIAFDSGFNSKTTFNRAFKKHVGLTPNQYIKNLNEMSTKS